MQYVRLFATVISVSLVPTMLWQAWDWVEGVLASGLFDSDVDETGNIMMYNQLVGAVRLRQQRVSNTSCTLSDNIQSHTFSTAFTVRQDGGCQ